MNADGIELLRAIVQDRGLGEGHEALDELIALLTQTQDALREIQWSGYAVIGIEPCPACGNECADGHAEGCIVAAALDRRLV